MLEMARVFEDFHPLLHREVILTAFSLKPEKPLYDMVRSYYIRVQKIRQDQRPNSLFQVVAAAKRSDPEDFEQNVKNTEEDTPMETDLTYRDMKVPNEAEFGTICNAFTTSLASGFGKSSMDRAAKVKHAKNLVGMLSIEGNSLTSAPHYNPTVPPFKAFLTEEFKVVTLIKFYFIRSIYGHLFQDCETLLSDLLITINSPRWHLLSWLFDWSTLSERCQSLLGNPKIKSISDELKYLVIDYTQFDEWSSEDELNDNTGIEKGYERWEQFESDNEEQGELRPAAAAATSARKSSSEEKEAKREVKKEVKEEPVAAGGEAAMET